MADCVFCGKQIPEGSGFTLFKKAGSAQRYCSRKCLRNAELKRNPRDFKWTKAGAKKS
ncbi:MAG: 50S ribosomal protein L24e [Candidatus Micrarchaeota archaeon]